MAYDSLRGVSVMFGGEWSYSDTWEWDGATWVNVSPATGPQGRYGHNMVFDSSRGVTVLFGGAGGWAGPFGETWEWDGQSWTQAASLGPTARTGHAMAYDSQRGVTVLFGGNSTGMILNDTWEWDGATWIQVANSGPGILNACMMVYDSTRNVSVLFGGNTGNGASADTWTWDGASWLHAASSGPPARWSHGLSYDSNRDAVVMFGGYNGWSQGDTWEWGGIANSPNAATSFGTGCGSPPLALSPTTSAPPIINTTAQVDLTNIPSAVAVMSIGWSNTFAGPFPLPLNLSFYGMPGCELLQSAEIPANPVSSTGPGAATYSLAIPNWPTLLGYELYLQGFAFAPNYNAGAVIVSNGIQWVIGNV